MCVLLSVYVQVLCPGVCTVVCECVCVIRFECVCARVRACACVCVQVRGGVCCGLVFACMLVRACRICLPWISPLCSLLCMSAVFCVYGSETERKKQRQESDEKGVCGLSSYVLM